MAQEKFIGITGQEAEPVTNGDKIRKMKYRELAAVLMDSNITSVEKARTMNDKELAAVIRCPYKKDMCLLDEADMKGGGTPPTEENCNRCARKWLEAEAGNNL
ncbi:MAG: hypothetical protein J6D08_16515 [Lachnospiraceae bacterium]|nr:hypothetical protein [Lachnospiraceae bacterium]